ncbi:MAG: FG-GAP repeat domain-containing protein [Pyrinomonadaceae bacterium]
MSAKNRKGKNPHKQTLVEIPETERHLTRLVAYIKQHWVITGIVALAAVTVVASGLKYLDEDAKRQKSIAAKDRSTLSRLNPFVTEPLPNPTPQLSKEYIYASGGRLLAAEDANANAAPPADLAVWRPSTGVWWVLGGVPGSQQVAQGWGMNGDIPAQGDFDGDGKTDFSIYRPSTGTWWILKSSDSTHYAVQFGISTDNLAQADFDGDRRTDVAVWRNSDGVWYIILSSTGGVQYAQYGTNGDKPAPADYDGDGRADIAVWRSSNRNFYSINSSNAQPTGASFGSSGDTAVCADYDGDGKANYALRSGASWIILNAALTQTTTTTPSGDQANDIPVQNDFDGDGKVDIAVWRDSNGNWYIRQSASNNSLRQVQWGMSGDIPVPAYFRR